MRESSDGKVKKRIAIVDNDILSLRMLSEIILSSCDEYCIAWTSLEGGSALKRLLEDQHKPDLLLLDVSLTDTTGIALCKNIRRRKITIPILLITAFPLKKYWTEAIAAGAQGIIEKEDIGLLRESINGFLNQNSQIAKGQVKSIFQNFDSPQGAAIRLMREDATTAQLLSQEEKQILHYTIKGKSLKQIATILSIKPSTIRNYAQHAREKLHAGNLAEAAVIWLKKSDEQ